jgi:hypothetical protein
MIMYNPHQQDDGYDGINLEEVLAESERQVDRDREQAFEMEMNDEMSAREWRCNFEA